MLLNYLKKKECLHMELNALLTYEKFTTAFEKVKENNGSPGIDGVTVTQFNQGLKGKLQQLIYDISTGVYGAKPCKNIDIPKKSGAFRTLSIPTVRDRIVHTVLSQALVPFFEPHFEKGSYGYRPKRSYLQAIKQIEKYRERGYRLVLDADIKSYFEHIPHTKLMTQLADYLVDKPLLNLVETSLLAMQYHKNKRLFGADAGLGLPQGSPLSPVLANLYLDPLDEALQQEGFIMVRYADDFVVLCKSNSAAAKAMALTKQLLETLHLAFNYDKTRIVDFESGFVFLGHYFVDNLVQPLHQETGKALRSEWVWDTPSLTNNEPFNLKRTTELRTTDSAEPSQFDFAQQFEREIVDCSTSEHINQLNENNRSDIRLVSKLRTLYLITQGSVVHKLGGRFEVKHAGEVLTSIPINQVDNMMIFGAIHHTRAVLIECIENHIPILLMTKSGHFIGMAGPNTLVTPKTAEAQLNQHESKKLNLAATLVNAKIINSYVFIKRKMRYLATNQQLTLSKLLVQLKQLAKQASNTKTIPKLRGVEGIAAKTYFYGLQQLIDKKWQFNNRNRRPPEDPVNALLSFGYHILFGNVQALIHGRGLLNNIGYLHNAQYQPSLALDLMEPFRAPVVDSTVVQFLASSAITPADFLYDNGACLISATAKKRFITAMESKLQASVQFRELGITTDYRRVIDLQILSFKQALVTKNADNRHFYAFKIR